ncbi:hypothetical protein, partial [Ensifer sp. M14]|uniref:hypothetical protein n=1 Tax=Ensifer sp. M14 TaxID=2203782 RepID=UPI0011C070F5
MVGKAMRDLGGEESDFLLSHNKEEKRRRMTAFNPNDPVHAAAKDYRDAAKALFDTRNESSLD